MMAEAGDGEEAVILAVESHPDDVLLHIRMRGIDGLEATRRIFGNSAPADVSHTRRRFAQICATARPGSVAIAASAACSCDSSVATLC